jgi:hypothetical protein
MFTKRNRIRETEKEGRETKDIVTAEIRLLFTQELQGSSCCS